jgi:hypothetical protein
MKKTAGYYTVNNQEDEDGYTLYPLIKNIYEKIKREQQITASDNTSNKKPASARHSTRNLYMTPLSNSEIVHN